jgi:hypothetical protein
MPRRHIACQWNGQATRIIRNKCRGRTVPRPYVRLRSLAYVTGTMPRGSIGASPERGAEAYTVRSRHVSAPDPRLALIKAWVFSIPESRDPAVSGPDPTQRGPEPILGARSVPVEVLDLTRRFGLYIQGSSTFPWGSGLTVNTLEYIIFSGHVRASEPSTWRGRVLSLAQSSRPRLGRAMVWSHAQLLYHATKDRRVGTATSYSSKGYPCFRVLTVAPRAHLRGGCKPAGGANSLIGDWRAASARLLTCYPSIRLRSRQLPYLSPRLTELRPPRLVVSLGHTRGTSIPLHWFKKSPSLSSAAAPRKRTTGACGGSLFLHPGTGTHGV